MTTLRTLAALDSWSERARYFALAVAGRFGRPLDAEKLFGIETGKETRTSTGYRFVPRPRTADSVTVLPFHELLTRRWIAHRLKSKPGGVFLDIGAHCGSFGIQLEQRFDRVIAFEPLPANVAALEGNIALNGLGQKITVVPSAVSARSGTAQFQIFTDDNSSLLEGHPGKSAITVPITSVDEELVRLSIPPSSVRLVKIDVEGTELDVIAGAAQLLREGAPEVVLEADSPEEEEPLVREMSSRGYHFAGSLDGRNLLFSKRESEGESER